MTSINFKIIIFILLSSCSSHTLNKYSDNSNSTKIKSNELKNEVQLKKNKINKEKLENLFELNKPSRSVVFEFRKERYLEGLDNKEVDNKINYAQKPFKQHLKCYLRPNNRNGTFKN